MSRKYWAEKAQKIKQYGGKDDLNPLKKTETLENIKAKTKELEEKLAVLKKDKEENSKAIKKLENIIANLTEAQRM